MATDTPVMPALVRVIVREFEREARGRRADAERTLEEADALMRRHWVTVNALIAHGRGDLWALGPRGAWV